MCLLRQRENMHRACRQTQRVSTPAVTPSAVSDAVLFGIRKASPLPRATAYQASPLLGDTAAWGYRSQAIHHCRYVVALLSPPPWLRRSIIVTLELGSWLA